MKKSKVGCLVKDLSNIDISNKLHMLTAEKGTKDRVKKLHHNKGRVFTEEHKKKISNSLKKLKHKLGCKLTEEHKKKISLSRIDKKHTKKTKKRLSLTIFIKRRSKPVMVGIDFFESLSAAAKFYNTTVSTVKRRCMSDNFTGWNFANEDIIKDKIKKEINLSSHAF